MRVALVHDYLREYGGAERVLEKLHEMFPEAPVYVGFVDFEAMGERGAKRFADWDIRTTWLQKVPLIKKLYSPLRIWAPKAFEKLDLSKYDLVISSSNAYFAKAVKVPNGVHFCYCHTPARSLYGYDTQSSRKRNKLMRLVSNVINHFLRIKDFEVAQKVDVFLANSEVVRARIKKFYRREAEVLYPPVKFVDEANKKWQELQKEKKDWLKDAQREKFYLYINRLNFAKHPELAVAVAQKMKLRLRMIGNGPMKNELIEQIAEEKNNSKVMFLENIGDGELLENYLKAEAVFYPVVDEDFGMIPIEAMAMGTPVIAHKSGGPTETIEEGMSGVFFEEIEINSMQKAVEKSQKIKWQSEKIHEAAQKFSARNFEQKLKKLVKKYVTDGKKRLA